MPEKNIYIVDYARTPYLKMRGKPGHFSASDLAVTAGRDLLARQPFAPSDIGEVIMGCVMPSENEANIARIISLRLGCGKSVPAWTVQRNCASGMQALDCAAKDILSGRHDLVLAGGTEAMSRAPLLFNPSMVNWMADWQRAKTFGERVRQISKFRPHYLGPVIALIRGLTDPVVGLNMGQTAENIATRFNITREEMDAFSLRSHQRVAKAQDAGHLEHVVSLFDAKGKYYSHDDGLRRDTTLEKLAELKPFFDKKYGRVTAGNSSQVTDGAAVLLLASEEGIKKYKLNPIARIVDVEWSGYEPAEMGLGPVFAAAGLLKRAQLKFSDIDFWEINEAFATQVLACLKAWQDKEFCKSQLGLEDALGKIDEEKLNVDGGAVALGHPVGSSGARIVMQLTQILKRNKAKRGIATICIGGGQGGAMLIENV